jgi:hypothetical protein
LYNYWAISYLVKLLKQMLSVIKIVKSGLLSILILQYYLPKFLIKLLRISLCWEVLYCIPTALNFLETIIFCDQEKINYKLDALVIFVCLEDILFADGPMTWPSFCSVFCLFNLNNFEWRSCFRLELFDFFLNNFF